ncbi:uncharacterized protein MYCFIDRAFT_158285 [Pseudocercospora fijiensis CIRAD86]|uniref:Pre-mRNA-splicing factor n=1 Tax=Pseudocercospora fijiensis (strain CIRAD86) TaxID=383855 RepID=M2YI68_PSEFD|nr:uncharacterized protein MYCFIDRAFT_158285 [Pseudocercospora fijiensis CIRAD86]EME77465.1 hypothetical protein MYCFIDRAFT_158285 [Pseudocercospora fijiensis CIRAD86]
MSRPAVSDLTGDHEIARIARSTWLASPTPPKVLPQTVAELWKLVEDDHFSAFSLLLLEQLQALERYLWPGYGDEASNQHLLLLVLLVNTKRQEHLPVWSLFSNTPDEFAHFFRRVVHLSIDPSLATNLRECVLALIVAAYQSLDHGIVRKECAPLVSIGIWHHLHDDATRERLLAKNVQLQKAWRAAGRKFDNADAAGQAKLRLERSWLHELVLHTLDKLYEDDKKKEGNVAYCERLLELLGDLQSQLPTRRYVNTLLRDMNLLPAILLSPMYQDEERIRDMYRLLEHYTHFPLDDYTGRQLSRREHDEAQNASISRLQKVAMKLQPEKLKILILTNFGALAHRDDLEGHLKDLTDAELHQLCQELGVRTSQYPEKTLLLRDRAFVVESLVSMIAKKPHYAEDMRPLRILPTEDVLYDRGMMRTEEYTSGQPLPLPKLNLQYLSVGDFLWRSFILYRQESFYGIRKHIEDTVKRLRPRRGGGQTRFDGFSRMAIPIPKPAIIETTPPRVGETVPAEVKVEIILDVSRLQPGLRREWESLRPDDTVFLLALHPEDSAMKLTNGAASNQSYMEKTGLKTVRCAEIISVLDENGRALRYNQDQQDHIDGMSRPRQRRLLLRIDPIAYKADKDREDAGKGDIYESINLIIRRRSRENNFRPVLESIKQLALSDMPLPGWFEEVFLGTGDPSSATYKRLSNKLKNIDYRDTFLDWQHLIESLPGKTIEPDPKLNAIPPPPYVLEATGAAPAAAPPKKGKKRRHDQPDGPEPAPSPETFRVSTYTPPNNGPYPTDAPKTNAVRFTPTQIHAVTSGTQPGLTVVVGPPGTGKTDVATQIISNIYHNFPQQRTLLVAHSNQALNQLFQKITALDIDERHLLRLGHGEEELTTEASFSKAGRVESFLERGAQFLAEVQRLAASIQAPGAHGNSCETAEYFNQVWVQPLWKRFWDLANSEESTAEAVVSAFPFHSFFADAPQPLFPPDTQKEHVIEIAKGCERHINRIFSELADIRPFEILRAQRDKSNYLLVKEARIIAMTSTHAAIRRQEIAQLGFKYDNVIMEEAAQITEVENFIPFVLQNPIAKDEKSPEHENPLKRVVLVGDHLQNSPVIQNPALKSYCNLEQSLFQRLVRLGVPHTQLDAQGRSRPSIANLYKWRYPSLTNLAFTSTAPEFVQANAGFRHEYQFINVDDYKCQGESEPTPHFIQNLGEAEYAVALYQYMRLLGYPAEKISILTAYAGQRALIRDVLTHRCKSNRLFGMPAWVGTVDKYQGEQNDYIILSLVRTKTPGYLRDLRRLTVALSRARLGLYVLGRKEVFESSLELREAFEPLFEKSTKLELVGNEMFGATQRLVDDANVQNVAEMAGVEHLGQYVFEMTQAKVKALKEGGGQLPPLAQTGKLEEDYQDEGDNGEGIEAGEEMDEDMKEAVASDTAPIKLT